MAGDTKTEKASPKKRKDERKKGNVFQSKDIVSILSTLIMFIVIKMYFPVMYDKVTSIITEYIEYVAVINELTPAFLNQLTIDLMIAVALIVLPIALLGIFIAIIATGVQTKFLISFDQLKPKFSRMDPLKGVAKMFSLKSAVEVLKGILKICVIAYLMYDFFGKNLVDFSKLYTHDIIPAALYIFDLIIQLVINISLIFIFIAALDFIYQWWEYEKQIKMSKHDVKEEYKQMEGDPIIKGKIKQQQQKMAMSRMMQAVPSADVIIKNPTHYAVALKYDIHKDGAPILIARGQDDIALKIIEIATENDVYVVENPPIARAIYATTDINQEISSEFFNIVAEILALVYEIKNKKIDIN